MDVVACVREGLRRRVRKRSWAHAALARAGKRGRRFLKYRFGVRAVVKKFIRSNAVREGDLAALQVKKSKPGRGGYKRWLPHAALRVCFGRI